MFKALAELVMRGRMWAVAIALLGSWLPFISQAVLGIVTLRKGWREGLLVTLWASLPAFAGLWTAQVSVPMALAAVAVFFVGYISSCVLRYSVSWPLTLSALVALTIAASIVILAVSDGFVAQVSAFFEELMTPPEGEMSEEVRAFIDGWNTVSASGLIAYWVGVGSLGGLLVGRWWQALLYNPGGFRQEMHQLRLPVSIALVSAGAWLYANTQGADYKLWGNLFALPLWVSGLCLAHWLVARFKLGLPALVTIYVLVPLVSAAMMILMLLALLDAGLDLRQKFKNDQPSDG